MVRATGRHHPNKVEELPIAMEKATGLPLGKVEERPIVMERAKLLLLDQAEELPIVLARTIGCKAPSRHNSSDSLDKEMSSHGVESSNRDRRTPSRTCSSDSYDHYYRDESPPRQSRRASNSHREHHSAPSRAHSSDSFERTARTAIFWARTPARR